MPAAVGSGAYNRLPLRLALAFLACLLAAGAGHAQPAVSDGGDSKVAFIARTTTPPVIDGLLDDAAWEEATVIEDFFQVNPVEYATPTVPTRVYLLFDDDHLYVGARMFDREPDKIVARVLRQGQPLGSDDRFFVHIDPFNSRRTGYLFGANANGVRFDGVFQNVTERQFDWDGIWDAAGNVDAEGWTVEMAIPFKTLSFDPHSDTWRMNFARTIIRTNETMAWATRNRNQDPSIMGSVVGFTGLRQGLGLDVVPALSLRERRSYAPSSRHSNHEPSLDIFYKLTPSLNGALTINTDFSATEVDDRQINLTRFNLFFPERRNFFLQDLDIFQFGRIGRGNTGNNTLDNTAASDASIHNARPFFSRSLGLSARGEEVPLEYGGKLSGRAGRWDVGLLAIRQDEHDGIVPTNAFVGRVAANVLEESSVGVIVTDGDPISNLHNRLWGVDFRYLNSRLPGGRSLETEVWYQHTDTEGLTGAGSAAGAGIRMPNNTGLRAGAAVKRVERNFNPALGFVSRTGIRDYTAELGHTRRPRGGIVRTYYSGVDVQRIEFLDDGHVQSEVFSLRALEVENHRRDQLNARYVVNREGLRRPFEISPGVIIPAGDYSFNHYQLSLQTGNQRPVSGSFTFQEGDFFDGERRRLSGQLRWRPGKHFQANLRYDYHDVELPQGEFIVRLARVQLETAFSTKLAWTNLFQYDSVSASIGVNSRLHWIPVAGREAFLVLNRNFADLESNGSYRTTYSEAAVKVGYTLRF